jgi:hypothetical protein
MKNTIDRVSSLEQSDATWLCLARRAPTWVTPKKATPYRPYMVL